MMAIAANARTVLLSRFRFVSAPFAGDIENLSCYETAPDVVESDGDHLFPLYAAKRRPASRLGLCSVVSMTKVMRSRWTVEKGVMRLWVVGYPEHPLPGRKVGSCLSTIRNVALNVIRREG